MFEILFKILFSLAIGALAWMFPPKPRMSDPWETPADQETLRRLNRKAAPWAVIGFLLWMLVGTFGIGVLLRLPMEWLTAQQSDALYRIPPDWIVWFIAGGFFMFAWARQPVEGFIRMMAGQSAIDAMNIENERQYGIDTEPFWRWFSRAFTLMGCAWLLLMTDYDVRVYEDRMVVNDWTSLFQKRTIPLNQISSITYAKHRFRGIKSTDEPAYFLRFMDASEWRSVNFNIENQESVFQFLGEKSGAGIDTVEVWR